MPCNISVICFVDQYSETAGKSNFIANAVGLVNSRNQNINIYVHIVAFYPKDSVKDTDLEKFKKGDIITVRYLYTRPVAYSNNQPISNC